MQVKRILWFAVYVSFILYHKLLAAHVDVARESYCGSQ